MNPQALKSVVELVTDFKFNKIGIGEIPDEVYSALKSLRGIGGQTITTIQDENHEESESSLQDFTTYIKSQVLSEIIYDNNLDLKKKLDTLSKWKDLYVIIENEMSIQIKENLKESERLKKELVHKNEELEYVLSSIKTLVTPRMSIEDREKFLARCSEIIANPSEAQK